MEKSDQLRVVGIGASAGGLEALQAFFKHLPDQSGLAYVVVQHLSPDYRSMMDELLARHTRMPIHVIRDGMTVEADSVYLIPPRQNLKIYRNRLFLEKQDTGKGLNLPIDIFFRSLAEEKEKNAIGIILSGTGSDGTMGTREIKENGGLIMVQDEKSSKFNGMPSSAISTGLVDYILSPEKMGGELINYVRHPLVRQDKSIGELVEEISTYHRELEFQNDELRRTQLEMEELKEHFNSLFEHAPVGYVVCNEEFRIESFNQRFRDMISWSRDTRGLPVNQFIDPVSQDDFSFFLRDLAKKRGNEPVRVEVTMTDTTHSVPVKIEGNRFRKGKKDYFRLAIVSLVRQKETENRLRQKSIDLGERVKELQCLYDISRFTGDKTLPVEDVMQKVVERLPSSWQFPGETVARIVINGKEFTCKGFRETRWSLSRDISTGSHKTGRIEVFYTSEKPNADVGPFMKEERDLLNAVGSYLEQYLLQRESVQELRNIEWMLQGRAEKEMNYVPPHGRLNALNKNGMILGLVGEEELKEIASDYLDLLETSAAIYERNGDYALGMFSSGWCRMMDSASRQLCATDDNREAMESGKWLCHESCWKYASLRSMKEDRPVDVACSGGIKLYALPVKANGEIVGSINFGYGDPPKDEETLRELSEKYQIPLEKLRGKAHSYPSRPRYIIDTAKKRLHNSATLLGSLIERHLAQQELAKSNENLRITLHSIGDAVIATDTKGKVVRMNPVAEQMTGWSSEEGRGKKLSTIFKIINAQTRKKRPIP